ncbi:MAG: 7-carboxy-7-deazaguanine synthase [Candidatus Protistobacter heckmanni]|nr:7-carboxy-7-deazaguanine synthase [Candidatus Protistobacter heckmanni]
MSYQIKEIFYTLQGEGAQAGRAAVFCRFAGCNLWSGRESDRAAAGCRFCDTDFVGADGENGGRYRSAVRLAQRIESCWPTDLEAPRHASRRFVVLTGGEPLLQVDAALLDALHARGFEVAVETNGTRHVPAGVDWVCVSPKAGAGWVQLSGDELKVVWPQKGLELEDLERGEFQHRFLQPMDGAARAESLKACVAACLARPLWRLSLQTHKLAGLK